MASALVCGVQKTSQRECNKGKQDSTRAFGCDSRVYGTRRNMSRRYNEDYLTTTGRLESTTPRTILVFGACFTLLPSEACLLAEHVLPSSQVSLLCAPILASTRPALCNMPDAPYFTCIGCSLPFPVTLRIQECVVTQKRSERESFWSLRPNAQPTAGLLKSGNTPCPLSAP